MTPRLRLYTEDDVRCSKTNSARISVPLAEILEPLLDAACNNCSFLRDFAGDELQLPADLFEVLTAYKRSRISARAA